MYLWQRKPKPHGARRDVTVQFYGTDVIWFGHSKIIDGVPYRRKFGGPDKEHYRGFVQGFGPFAVEVTWPH